MADFSGMKIVRLDLMPVPTREPEIVRAEANEKFGGDDEKVATSSLGGDLIVYGVHISSRYGKAHELELMRFLVARMPDPFRKRIETIWCDSKANYVFTIWLRDGPHPHAWADLILGNFEQGLVESQIGGHNGIYVLDESSNDLGGADPNWPAEDALLAELWGEQSQNDLTPDKP